MLQDESATFQFDMTIQYLDAQQYLCFHFCVDKIIFIHHFY